MFEVWATRTTARHGARFPGPAAHKRKASPVGSPPGAAQRRKPDPAPFRLPFLDTMPAPRPEARVVRDNCDCTVCAASIPPADVMMHPYLGVTVCSKCESDIGTSSFEVGEDAMEDLCRWCAEGGDTVFMCDTCTSCICMKCVKRNLGEAEFHRINNAKSWDCYLCKPRKLEGLQKKCKSMIAWGREAMVRHPMNPEVPMNVSPLRSNEQWSVPSWGLSATSQAQPQVR